MNPDFTDTHLLELDREIGGLIARSRDSSTREAESRERIERILRRVRLEDRIADESAKSRGSYPSES